jgi:hypothetical protein
MSSEMMTFVGTKMVKAVSMSRGDYNVLRGWVLPSDECGEDAGYLVEYVDGGKPNLAGYDGYVSWSPAEQFETAYRPVDGMPFGVAVEMLKKGSRISRKGWNGKRMWLGLVKADNYTLPRAPYGDGELAANDTCAGQLPWICMKTADNKIVPWLASQTDVLADDWCIVN